MRSRLVLLLVLSIAVGVAGFGLGGAGAGSPSSSPTTAASAWAIRITIPGQAPIGTSIVSDTGTSSGGLFTYPADGSLVSAQTTTATAATSAQRFATVSFAGLDRLEFGGASHEVSVAARTALAAYALLADRLAFSAASVWLRSGCELVTIQDTLEWFNRGGTADSFALNTADAIALYTYAVQVVGDLGLPLSMTPVRLNPGTSLAAAIDFALTKTDTTGD